METTLSLSLSLQISWGLGFERRGGRQEVFPVKKSVEDDFEIEEKMGRS